MDETQAHAEPHAAASTRGETGEGFSQESIAMHSTYVIKCEAALKDVRGVEAYFDFSSTRTNPRSVTTHGWESQKPK